MGCPFVATSGDGLATACRVAEMGRVPAVWRTYVRSSGMGKAFALAPQGRIEFAPVSAHRLMHFQLQRRRKEGGGAKEVESDDLVSATTKSLTY